MSVPSLVPPPPSNSPGNPPSLVPGGGGGSTPGEVPSLVPSPPAPVAGGPPEVGVSPPPLPPRPEDYIRKLVDLMPVTAPTAITHLHGNRWLEATADITINPDGISGCGRGFIVTVTNVGESPISLHRHEDLTVIAPDGETFVIPPGRTVQWIHASPVNTWIFVG